MLIAVEENVAQHLHVNTRMVDEQQLMKADCWSIRATGDFMIIMNNLLTVPIIVRHPQRFNDSRSFVAAFKREFIHVLEDLPIPRAKVKQIRERQFAQIKFVRSVAPALQQRLQIFQNLLTRPDAIQWDADPSNSAISFALMKKIKLQIADSGSPSSVADLVGSYVMNEFKVPAHPKIDDHNEQYLYQASTLNDVMKESAVSELIIRDYQTYLKKLNKSDRVIERNVNEAIDFIAFLSGNEETILEDLTTVYYYVYRYSKRQGQALSRSRYKEIGMALREFARFLRKNNLFSPADFDQFSQALSQAIDNATPVKEGYRLERMIRRAEGELERRRTLLRTARQFGDKQYQLQVELATYEPMMWRQININGETRLDELCYCVLASFGAQGSHLFALQAEGKTYQLPYLDGEEDITLHWLGEFPESTKFKLEYDFGESWQFNIKINKIKPHRRHRLNSEIPQIVGGSGQGIIDDIGGVAGLELAAQDDSMIDEGLDISQLQNELPARMIDISHRYQ